MRLRSLLFVPGDRGDRMEKALASGADALILDLEDAVLPAAKAAARDTTAAFLRLSDRPIPFYVRVNPLGSGMTADDVAAVLDARPDALVLPKAEGAMSVAALSALAPGVPILPIATETPAAIFALGSYAQVAGSLAGLTWGAEDLPAAIGATSAREADGRYTPPYELARSLTLFAAHAAQVPAIETVYPAFRDLEGLAHYVARAACDGFTAMLAIHPAQVPVINAGMTPDAATVAHAQAVIAAFAAAPGAGAVQIDGRMLDAPHLALARTVLTRAGRD
ncbi:citrate lyase [Sphingomonas sp. Leaf407]|uniref:HpcH/HpaI aldolase/citrate lyase family protein n=1 Tax=unclassified Sphingomonas TaxID=196159 RepID=UPI0006FC9AFF|nr:MULTISPECIES: CoA ester lyase [unclassified Sphingomonas]KQN36692.1 citrate lyase [Sphingomonas sp. Leaf42]KQT27314.1 citrate lyase [Sphingomonas sp. Leaf407]